MFCDLHMHSTASDGTDAPGLLPALARAAGLAAIALTDHDTTAGIAACAQACDDEGLAFIAGIELSASPQQLPGQREDGKAGMLHILGYGITPQNEQLAQIQSRLVEAREQRNPEIIANLNKLGVNIAYDEVLELVGGQGNNNTIVGRPHIAQILVQRGYVRTIHEAFARYIGEGAAAYARKDRLPPDEAIQVIHNAGGLAVLAHPVQLRRTPADLEAAVAWLARLDIDGIETRHSDHAPQDIEYFEKLAKRYNLIPTGGSDYHGSRKNIALNNSRVPFEVFTKLRDAAGEKLAIRGPTSPAAQPRRVD